MKTTHEDLEIQSVLKDYLEVENSFIIWQRDHANQVMFQIKSTLSEIGEDGMLKFKINPEQLKELDTDHEIYFAAKTGKVIYKVHWATLEEGVLTCQVPDTMSYKERRETERSNVKKMKPKEVELQFIPKEKGAEPIRVKTRVKNFSDGGMCFILSDESLGQLDGERLFEIVSSDVPNAGHAVIKNTRQEKKATRYMGKQHAVGVMYVHGEEEDDDGF